jgi:polysaccharide chain length determinant protein (PEP-CTERM system associated)
MKNLTLSELVRIVRRRPAWFIVPLLLGLIGAVAALQMLPRTYRASTQVLVEPQKVPADYVKPTVTSSIEERLRSIEPQIKNSTNMERIIREMNLYPELRREWSMERVINKVRNDLTVRVQANTFYIYFIGREPVTVAKTANRVAELFIQSNLALRENQAAGTSTFLETELAATKQRLELQEARIAAFKRTYMGELPEQRDTNLRSIEQLQTKLEINMDAMDKAETRRILLQGKAAELRYPPELRSPGGTGSGSRGPAAPAPPTRLELLQTELAGLLGRYTERHPDVIRVKEEIARLEELERQRPPAPPVPEEEVEISAADPLPLPRTPRMDPVLRAELDAVDREIRGLRAERDRILADIGGVQARLVNVPRVEQELLSLTRDYDNIKGSYESLLDKRLNARLYENLEKSQQAERFTILERAAPPTAPHGPKKLLVLAVGLVAGCLAGLGATVLRDQTDPTYTDAESLQQAFPGVPLLAIIPVLGPGGVPAQLGRGRRRH